MKNEIVAKSMQAPCWGLPLVPKLMVLTGCLQAFGNNFIFHFWFFSQSQPEGYHKAIFSRPDHSSLIYMEDEGVCVQGGESEMTSGLAHYN